MVTGSGAWSLSFTTFNDWLMASFVCEGLRLLLKANRFTLDDRRADVTRAAFRSGVLFAIAICVKFTAAPFVVAAFCIGVIVLNRRRIISWLAGLLAAFALTSGPWMVYLWFRFGSPVFPWYNGIFQSPSASRLNFKDPRFGFRSPSQVLSFPIDILRGTTLYSEASYHEWRFLAVLLLAATCAAVSLYRAGRRGQEHVLNMVGRTLNIRSTDVLLGLFTAVSFGVWVITFGYYRYLLPAEIVISILTVVLVHRLLQGRVVPLAGTLLVLIVSFALLFTPSWGRTNRVFRVSVPVVDEGAFILFADGGPSSYLAESFPSDARFASTAAFSHGSNTRLLAVGGPLWRELQEFVAQGQAGDRLYLLLSSSESELPILSDLDIRPDPTTCVAIPETLRFISDARLCRTKATPTTAEGQ